MIFDREKRLEKDTIALNINKNILYIYCYEYLKENIFKN